MAYRSASVVALALLSSCVHAPVRLPDDRAADVVLCEGSYQLKRVAVLGEVDRSTDFFQVQGRIATSAPDRTTTLWDAVTGVRVAELYSTRPGFPELEDFSPDEELMIWNDGEGGFDLRRTSTGKAIARLKGQALFSADGSKVVDVSDDKVAVIDTRTGRELTGMAIEPDHGDFLLSSDGRRLIDSRYGSNDEAFDLFARRPLYRAADEYASVEFDDEGAYVLQEDDEGWKLIDLASGKELKTGNDDEYTYFIDGGRFVGVEDASGVSVLDARTGKRLIRTGPLAGSIAFETFGLEFSPDRSRVVAREKGGAARLWDLTTGQMLAELGAFQFTTAVDETIGDGNVDFFNLPDTTGEFRFIANGERLVTLARNGDLRVWDVRTGERVSLVARLSASDDVEFSKANDLAVVLPTAGNVTLWNLITGKQIADLGRFGETVYRIHSDFPADGRRLMMADDERVEVWDTASGERLWRRNIDIDDDLWSADAAYLIVEVSDKDGRTNYQLLDGDSGKQIADLGAMDPELHWIGSKQFVLGSHALWDLKDRRLAMDCGGAAESARTLPFHNAYVYSVGNGLSFLTDAGELWRIEPRR